MVNNCGWDSGDITFAQKSDFVVLLVKCSDRVTPKMNRSLTMKFITTPSLAKLSATLLMFVGGFRAGNFNFGVALFVEGIEKSCNDSEWEKGLKTIFSEVFFEARKY